MNQPNQKQVRIGMLTPSSNTVVEPWCFKIVDSFENTSVHFGRVEVLWIDDKEASFSQFYDENMLRGFELLSHVKPTVIGWNGTSASWLGIDQDRILVKEITRRTGYPAVTSTLSIIEALRALKIKKIGLVTPYVNSIQERIINNFSLEKLDCISERHFNLTDNFSFGEVSEDRIESAAEEVVADGAEAVIILCTNLAGAGIAARLEDKTGVPILDSVVLTVWGALRTAGISTSSLEKWSPAISNIL
ncbi:MAG: Asp/Glu/hydantoin racemase [Rhodobacteraceae bacterium]|nr:MAG: Asp/Glu/hydantoin racemase [Paracoccaceae bacterium]